MKFPFIYDADGTLSIGRTFLVLLLILAILKFWWIGIDIPSTLETIVMSLLGYELGKKARDTVIKVKTKGEEDAEA